MGWNARTKGITSFANSDGNTIDIIKSYGQIDELTLRTTCERFCKAGKADAKSRARQNNTMMGICLLRLLMAEAQVRLLTYHKDYLINEVECAPLMYKVIMRLARSTLLPPPKLCMTTFTHWEHLRALSVATLTR